MRHLVAFSLAALAVSNAAAATLRPMTTLNRPVVLLSDLFDDAGANAAKVLGPGPALGGRIVVEAAQLAAIARQFGVNWRPGSPADRAVLDRPGRPLAREEALAAIRSALTEAGAADGFEIELPDFSPPLVPLEGAVQPVLAQLEYDPSSGRFAGVLSITAAGAEPIHVRIVGRVQETIEVPVAAIRLAAGSVLGPQDLRMARIRSSLLRAEVARSPQQVVGLALRHPAIPGQPFPVADLAPPSLVEKGALITMQLDSPGIALVAQGQALEPGAMGERIRVLNPVSRAVIEAEVTGPNRVRVRPDQAPLMPAGRTSVAAIR